MDYEKAYKEALKRAKEQMESAEIFDYSDEQTAFVRRKVTTNIFPELKESEDEKIRKELLEAVDYGRVFDIEKETADRWTAWLERQNVTDPDVKMNHPLYLEGFDVGKEVGEIIKEQKSAELVNAILKLLRGRCTEHDVITEIADVQIMTEQLSVIFGDADVAAEKRKKLDRVKDRIVAYGKELVSKDK